MKYKRTIGGEPYWIHLFVTLQVSMNLLVQATACPAPYPRTSYCMSCSLPSYKLLYVLLLTLLQATVCPAPYPPTSYCMSCSLPSYKLLHVLLLTLLQATACPAPYLPPVAQNCPSHSHVLIYTSSTQSLTQR